MKLTEKELLALHDRIIRNKDKYDRQGFVAITHEWDKLRSDFKKFGFVDEEDYKRIDERNENL
jgi:hypothetical protein